MQYLFYCLLCSSISPSWLCFYINQLTLFFIVCSANNSLCSMIKSISCFKLLSVSIDKLKWITFDSVINPSLLLIVFNGHSHYYNHLIKFLQSVLMIVLCWSIKYTVCLVSVCSLYVLFPAFIWAGNTRRLVNSLFRVKISCSFFYLFINF